MKGPLFISAVALVLSVAGFFVGPTAKEIVVGAMPGNEFQQASIIVNGVETYQGSASLKNATTTVCAIKSPSATSTLVHAGVRIGTASSTATVWDIAKADNAFATTTALASAHAVGAGASDFILASTSPTGGDAVVFSPNQWLVVGVRQAVTPGSAGTGFAPVGECQAQFVAY